MIKPVICPDPFTLFNVWQRCLSDDDQRYAESRWREWANAGKWCAFERYGGQRSTTYWPKDGLLEHFKKRYGVVRPDLVLKLEKALASEPADIKNAKRKKVRRNG